MSLEKKKKHLELGEKKYVQFTLSEYEQTTSADHKIYVSEWKTPEYQEHHKNKELFNMNIFLEVQNRMLKRVAGVRNGKQDTIDRIADNMEL